MFHIKGKCKVINANCFDVLKRMPDNCMDVTFTSLPYNRKRNGGYIKNSITTNINTKKFKGHSAVMKKE